MISTSLGASKANEVLCSEVWWILTSNFTPLTTTITFSRLFRWSINIVSSLNRYNFDSNFRVSVDSFISHPN